MMIHEEAAQACAIHSPLASFAVTGQGELSFRNAQYERLFGQAWFLDFLVMGSKCEALQTWKKRLEEGQSFEAEFDLHMPQPESVIDGVQPGTNSLQELERSLYSALELEQTRVSVSISPDPDGDTVYGVVRVIGHSEEGFLLHTLIDILPDFVYLKDVKSRFLLANRALAEFFGFSNPASLLGKTDQDFYPKEIADQCLADEQTVLARKEPLVNREEIAQDSMGKSRWLLTTKVPVIDRAGHAVGLFGISNNISREKQAMIELERTAKELEEANQRLEMARDQAMESVRAKSRFLANMSHEIRTPLNGVVGMIEILRQTALDADQKDYVDTIAASSENLLTVINDILDFSKIEAGKMSIESVEFEPAKLVSDVLRLYAGAAQLQGIEMICDTAPDAEAVCLGDPIRIRQVISNVVSNAIKFTPRGSVTVSASVTARGRSRLLALTVKDSGIGIAKDRIDSIFDAFTQGDASTTRRFGGTGLGLAICAQLVQLMGGRMEVESQEGKGSTFRIALPLRNAQSGRQLKVAQDQTHRIIGKGTRVLVADDNETNLLVATRLLESLGCSVERVRDGEAAVLAASQGFDLILMDCQMPVMDGYEATKLIRAKEQRSGTRTPIVALTASALAEDRLECLAAGMDEHLSKPLTRDALSDMVGRFLSAEAA
jgi:PAS domain S-box-containing protein